ncbi:MAG: hypothetical protein IKK92_01990 [Prevotella sp.]|nr:hypothetical protein [Prevotella sp.]
MKWIEYDYVCNADKDITLHKKVEYNDVNLAIAEAEACNGEYTITEDSEAIEVKPLAVELGGTGANTIKGVREKLGVEVAIPKISMNEPTAADNIATGYVIGKTWLRPGFELENHCYDIESDAFVCNACVTSKDGQVFTVAGNGDDKVISATVEVASANGWLYAVITPDASASSIRMTIGDVVKELAVGSANIICVRYVGSALMFEATYSTANVASTGTILVENLTVIDEESVASCVDFECDIMTEEILKHCAAETPFSSITIPTKFWQHNHDGEWGLLYGISDIIKDTYDLPIGASQDDVLLLLSRLNGNLGDEHIWKRTKTFGEDVPSGYTLGNVQSNVRLHLGPQDDEYYGTYYYVASSVSVDELGIVSLVSPSRVTLSYVHARNNLKNFSGKYISKPESTREGFPVNTVFYVPADASFICNNNTIFANTGWHEVQISKLQRVYGYAKIPAGTYVNYVNAARPDAYTETDSEGGTYEYLGQLGERARIATGSYVGTGALGSNGPCSITFDFAPKFLFIFESEKNISASNIDLYKGFIMPAHDSYTFSGVVIVDRSRQSGSSAPNALTYVNAAKIVNNTVSWYAATNKTQNAEHQLNKANRVYDYVAIG